VTGCGADDIAVGDFNGDGKPDLAATNSAVGICLGNGDGTFSSAAWFLWGNGVLAVGDFNLDGKLDVVVANYQLRYVSLLLNTTP
jgi:hypothetical protein